MARRRTNPLGKPVLRSEYKGWPFSVWENRGKFDGWIEDDKLAISGVASKVKAVAEIKQSINTYISEGSKPSSQYTVRERIFGRAAANPKRKTAKRKAKKAAKRKAPRKRGGKTLAAILKKAAKEKRPTRFRYDGEGNITGVYVPLKHQTKAEQKRATRAMVSACSAGAYRQGASPTRTCGTRGLKPSAEAGRGLAYARWGFPKGWPKPKRVNNPGYSVGAMRVKTFRDEDGDWGYAVYNGGGLPVTIASGEPSEKVAAREGKAEARFQGEILEIERRTMMGNPPKKRSKKKTSKKTTKRATNVRNLVAKALK